ncbi:MHYT domain-containing protein, partial [Morganella morganii]
MGCAIVGMHYTGMAAAQFPLGSFCGAAGRGIDNGWLAVLVIVITLAVIAIALIVSVLDSRPGGPYPGGGPARGRGPPGGGRGGGGGGRGPGGPRGGAGGGG